VNRGVTGVEHPGTGPARGVDVVDCLERLEVAGTGTRDRGLVRAGQFEERGAECRIDERHVAGNHERVLATSDLEAVVNSSDGPSVRIPVDRVADRERGIGHRVADRVGLGRPAVDDEFLDRVRDAVRNVADHRSPADVGDRLVGVAEARRASAGDDETAFHTRSWAARVINANSEHPIVFVRRTPPCNRPGTGGSRPWNRRHANTMPDHTHTPFKDRTSVAEARRLLREQSSVHGRTETVPIERADGRVVATRLAARRSVPHYPRAAMDGYAVRAADTFGAGDRSPRDLRSTEGRVGPGEARQVHTGSDLPDGADAVVMIERVEEVGDELAVFDAVGEGENVAPIGEDVERGQPLYDPGHRLRPSDLGLLRSVGYTEVTVYERPTVAVIPTGEELVQEDPGPGETIETNGLTVTRLARRWGAEPAYGDVVTDERAALAGAIRRRLGADVVVTTGGSSVGARDLLPGVVSDLGEMLVHGVSLKPGHPAGFGVVDGTPVLLLPGYPVSCLVNAVQFLRPAINWLGGTEPDPLPTVTARLAEKIHSEPGIRTFARVRLDDSDGDSGRADHGDRSRRDDNDGDRSRREDSDGRDDGGQDDSDRVATAVRASGAGVLSTVALSDGWVVVPEESEGIDAGTTVSVQRWEWSP
jgi:molybdopterin molybdotransferase